MGNKMKKEYLNPEVEIVDFKLNVAITDDETEAGTTSDEFGEG